ncbi:exocyst complex component EXO70H1-like [Triticum aestivum]|uniref:exocyst complex component EXO70H1-like n=1 Tax=Triticum aestivum TaxID=4565 RepID=UPI001D03566C|nr:exocyst complex component EXO70H1-like [Triticum aestivum]
MSGRLASVPEETTSGYEALSLYRRRIRTIDVSAAQTTSPFLSAYQSGHSGSSYSSYTGTSSSDHMSNNSGSSPRWVSAAATDLGAHELAMVARQMVSDGYIERLVQAANDTTCPIQEYGYGLGKHRVVDNWFFELDVDWVLRIQSKHDLSEQLQLQDKSASWLQNYVERWVRALMVIAYSIQEILAVTSFGSTGINNMVVFVDAIIPLLKVENLRHLLNMYVCVSKAWYIMTPPEDQSIINHIVGPLPRAMNKLSDAISSTMEQVRTLMEDDNSWAIEIPRGGGGVHRNTQLMVDYIVTMREALASMLNSAPSQTTVNLCALIEDTTGYLKDLLLRKSELCLDLSLRYLFLLNNFYFIAQVPEPSGSLNLEIWSGHHSGLNLSPECEKYMDSYLDVSWGHVLSCIPHSNSRGPFHCLINTSSLVKFQSAFHKTYQAQKFWKVLDPRLRDAMRRTITVRVISDYRDYLEEHPEVEKHVSSGSNSPDILEEMLGELFEG